MKDIKASTRKYKANFIVRKDEDGIFCAADLEQGIFADGKTEKELWEDILEAVECYFDIKRREDGIQLFHKKASYNICVLLSLKTPVIII